MPTSMSRRVVEQRDVDFLRVTIYNTGAIYFDWYERSKTVLRITQAKDLAESGEVWKIAALLVDPDCAHILGNHRRTIQLNYHERRFAEVKHVLDSSVSNEAKLIYFIGLMQLKFSFTLEQLDEIFEKRPDPRAELESDLMHRPEDEKRRLLAVFSPGFWFPPGDVTSFEELKKISLISAFLSSEKPITYKDFMSEHEDDYFIPHRAHSRTAEEFHPVSTHLIEDLYPAEYTRFMTFFAYAVPSELRNWARKRFDAGVEPFREAQLKGKAKLAQGNMAPWLHVINSLAVEEAKSFQEYLKAGGPLTRNFLGVDLKAGGLLAFYFAEGGLERFEEFLGHILRNIRGNLDPAEYYSNLTLKTWRNPYREDSRGGVAILPYVHALKSEEDHETPLEWVLATS